MMFTKAVLGTLCGLCVCSPAMAEIDSIFGGLPIYVGGSVFGTYRSDSDVAQNGTNTTAAYDYDAGAGVGVMVGARVSDNWRVQFDLKYQSNGNDKITSFSRSAGRNKSYEGVGRVDATYGLLSAYYDLPVSWKIRPFVGLGFGRAQIKMKNYGWAMSDGRLNQSDYAFVGQAALGASYRFNNHISAFLEYDYLKAQDVKYTNTPYHDSRKLEYASHDVGIGLRYEF